jgi:hypothetical protein
MHNDRSHNVGGWLKILRKPTRQARNEEAMQARREHVDDLLLERDVDRVALKARKAYERSVVDMLLEKARISKATVETERTIMGTPYAGQYRGLVIRDRLRRAFPRASRG